MISHWPPSGQIKGKVSNLKMILIAAATATKEKGFISAFRLNTLSLNGGEVGAGTFSIEHSLASTKLGACQVQRNRGPFGKANSLNPERLIRYLDVYLDRNSWRQPCRWGMLRQPFSKTAQVTLPKAVPLYEARRSSRNAGDRISIVVATYIYS